MNDLINQIRNVSYTAANSIIKQICGIVDYFMSEDEKSEFIAVHGAGIQYVCDDRASYGDWQTPNDLADKICDLHLSKYGTPDIMIEPTCGLGAFVFSALKKFHNLTEIHAIEINRQYTADLKLRLLINALKSSPHSYPNIYVYNADFFEFDLEPIIEKSRKMSWNLAVIGNPPWVTNSRQGKNNSLNLPNKKNSYGLKGIDAITGKSNFDISEYITLRLLTLSQTTKGGISFLLKNSVIRNILEKQHIENFHIGNIEQWLIDASKEFNVSVEASCFLAQFSLTPSFICCVKDLYSKSYVKDYGWIKGAFVSDTKLYDKVSKYDEKSSYVWRSGIKHDCSSVLELEFSNGTYVNGFGEIVQVEDDLIYPLLKSSDINHYQENNFRKFVIVPQRKVGDDTSLLRVTHPLTYSYLTKYQDLFLGRKSSIYKGKDKFGIFGIGDYSFMPYKIVVSSLYKTVKFIVVSHSNGKPVMVDDTCYQLGFDSLHDATCVLNALNSYEIRTLLQSLIFKDAKRVVTKSLLMRLDLSQICNEDINTSNSRRSNICEYTQLSLFE